MMEDPAAETPEGRLRRLGVAELYADIPVEVEALFEVADGRSRRNAAGRVA